MASGPGRVAQSRFAHARGRMRTPDPPIPLPLSPASAPRESEEVSQTARAFIGVRELLLRGEFARGERISEVPLAARLGVSRTPIRMALERLAHVGLLDVGATGGFLVRDSRSTSARRDRAARACSRERPLGSRRAASRRPRARRGCALLGRDRPPRAAHDRLVRRVHGRQRSFHAAIVDLAKSAMLRRMLDQRELAAVCGSERDGLSDLDVGCRGGDACDRASASPQHRRGDTAPRGHARRAPRARARTPCMARVRARSSR